MLGSSDTQPLLDDVLQISNRYACHTAHLHFCSRRIVILCGIVINDGIAINDYNAIPWAGMPTIFKVIGWIIFLGAIGYFLSK